MKVQKIAGITIIIIAIIYLLIVAQNILLPIVLAVFIWFLIKEIRSFFDRSKWIKLKVARWVKTILSSFILFVVIGFMSKLLIDNIEELYKTLPTYNDNITSISKTIQSWIGIDVSKMLDGYSNKINFQSILSQIMNSISEIFSNIFFIVIYLVFILMEESSFSAKMKAIYTDKEKHNRFNEILINVDKSILNYISIKTLLSIITATISYVILLIIGIDSALFWAFLIFILNFIPSIGSLIATLFPAVMALLQYGDTTFAPFYWVLLGVGLTQVVVGNFLEPKMMGKSLNISSLVVIVSLTVWGSIWGVVGMILSVPITVIIIIAFSHFESTKNIAILLSKDGKINY